MTDEMRQARINQNLMKKEGTGWDVGHGKHECMSPSIVFANMSHSHLVSGKQRSWLDHWFDHASRWGGKSSNSTMLGEKRANKGNRPPQAKQTDQH
jgi:hypothetical protein